MRFNRPNVLGECSGANEAAIIVAAGWRPRLTALSSSDTGSWQKAFDRQVAEVQIRAVILKRFTALGTPMTARVA